MKSIEQKLPKYQTLLQQELLDRKRLNPRYSSRAMARDLGLSAAFYSQLMSGKRSLSVESAELIARRLNWTAKKRKAFLLLAQIERTKSPELKSSLAREYRNSKVPVRERSGFRRLKLDAFNLISEWYHYALLELTELAGFQADADWIAQKLEIPVEAAKAAIDRLIRLGLLSTSWAKLESDYRIGDIPSEAIRNFHRQMLHLATRALDKQPPEERDFSGCTVALDPQKLPQIRELIRNFQKELMELTAEGEKTAVYQMSMQLFRLDRKD